MPMMGNDIQSHYRILVSRGDRRPYADLYAFNLQDIIPSFPLPLRSGDTEPIIDLQTLLNQVYDIYGYDLKAREDKEVDKLKESFVINDLEPYKYALELIKNQKIDQCFSRQDSRVRYLIKYYIDILIDKLAG
jgi:hypothetical protein